MSRRREWRKFEVAFTGPFLTGQPLRVSLSDYDRLQSTIGEALGGAAAGWDHEGLKWRGVESYGSGGGYTSLVPLVLIRREGEVLKRRLEQLQEQRPAAERDWLRGATKGWRWELRSLRIELYDLGVGVITGTYDVTAPLWLGPEETRCSAEAVGRLRDSATGRRSPVAASFDALSRETVALFADAVSRSAAGARLEPWLTPYLDALPVAADADGGRSGDEWGRLLWLHSAFVLTAGPGAGARRLQRISRPFEVAFSEPIEHWHGLFAPGIDSSVMVLHENVAKQKTPPMRLTELLSAYYGLFMEIDRGLLAMLDGSERPISGSLSELEAEADRIFAVYMRVQEARARLDSALTDLAGGQLSIWNAIARVQKFDELVAAVELKVGTLQRLAERRVEEAAAARARRTGNILSGLTALTVVTLLVAVMETLLGTRADADGHVELRAAIVLVAFAVAVAIYRRAARR